LKGLWKEIKEGRKKRKFDPVWGENYVLNHSSAKKDLLIFVNYLQIEDQRSPSIPLGQRGKQ